MKSINKLTLLLLIVILILSLSLVVIVTNSIYNDNNYEPDEVGRKHTSILINFDEKDLEQLDDLISRFKDGKGLYLMLIPPIVDGGYWIHDIHSNGREIEWSIDNSRDGMSGYGRGVRTYNCKSIDKNETDELYNIELSKCNNHESSEKLPVISIRKM